MHNDHLSSFKMGVEKGKQVQELSSLITKSLLQKITRLFLHNKHVWCSFDRLQEDLFKYCSINTIMGSVMSIRLKILSIQ